MTITTPFTYDPEFEFGVSLGGDVDEDTLATLREEARLMAWRDAPVETENTRLRYPNATYDDVLEQLNDHYLRDLVAQAASRART
jgi:hypothetical protein